MKALLLKIKKDTSAADRDIVVFDELIKGILTGEYFIPVFTGASLGMRIFSITFLVDNFYFPEDAVIPSFIKGADPELYTKIEFYKSDDIVI